MLVTFSIHDNVFMFDQFSSALFSRLVHVFFSLFSSSSSIFIDWSRSSVLKLSSCCLFSRYFVLIADAIDQDYFSRIRFFPFDLSYSCSRPIYFFLQYILIAWSRLVNVPCRLLFSFFFDFVFVFFFVSTNNLRAHNVFASKQRKLREIERQSSSISTRKKTVQHRSKDSIFNKSNKTFSITITKEYRKRDEQGIEFVENKERGKNGDTV